MNKVRIRKIFWEIANAIEAISDTIIKNDMGVVIERGMQLSNGYSAMFGLDTGALSIYDNQCNILIQFTEESEALLPLKELFENLELQKDNTAQEVPVQEQYVGKCSHCNKVNEITLLFKIDKELSFCMNCGKAIQYIKTELYLRG